MFFWQYLFTVFLWSSSSHRETYPQNLPNRRFLRKETLQKKQSDETKGNERTREKRGNWGNEMRSHGMGWWVQKKYAVNAYCQQRCSWCRWHMMKTMKQTWLASLLIDWLIGYAADDDGHDVKNRIKHWSSLGKTFWRNFRENNWNSMCFTWQFNSQFFIPQSRAGQTWTGNVCDDCGGWRQVLWEAWFVLKTWFWRALLPRIPRQLEFEHVQFGGDQNRAGILACPWGSGNSEYFGGLAFCLLYHRSQGWFFLAHSFFEVWITTVWNP